jgi:16S rRNA C967 or C1407 C5-methylase (RsmB/RsmF family)/NOL1/NOP2/fmu family ribosome biogenesis protein
MSLPESFLERMRPLLPADEFDAFISALSDTEPTTSVRLNPGKCSEAEAAALTAEWEAKPVAWCPTGLRLPNRPQFTLDPRLHAGLYYVQEEASMFVTHVLRSLLPKDGAPLTCLDLCAAPGGKSSALLSVVPEGSCLVSNEVDRKRVRILGENLTKWGEPRVTVTSTQAATLGQLRHTFDVILTDVPCSGEGMFRKDPGAVADWSTAKVQGCAALQREILTDIWPALKPGGLLVYSTCTFNLQEDEEQVKYLIDELGAEPLEVPVDPDWNIRGPLTGSLPVYRFMPHRTPGEGLFMAALRKPADEPCRPFQPRGGRGKGKAGKPQPELKQMVSAASEWLRAEDRYEYELGQDGVLQALPQELVPLHRALQEVGAFILQSGVALASAKGRDVIPEHGLAMSRSLADEAFPRVELDRETALSYLRRDALTPDASWPRGYVVVTYQDHPLGFIKNLGTRSNNLYPQEWRIRKL